MQNSLCCNKMSGRAKKSLLEDENCLNQDNIYKIITIPAIGEIFLTVMVIIWVHRGDMANVFASLKAV